MLDLIFSFPLPLQIRGQWYLQACPTLQSLTHKGVFFWENCSDNSGTLISLKKSQKYKMCFHLIPRCSIWGASDCLQKLTMIWLLIQQGHDFASCRQFLQLCDIVVVGTFHKAYKYKSQERNGELSGSWLPLVAAGYSLLSSHVQRHDKKKFDILMVKI